MAESSETGNEPIPLSEETTPAPEASGESQLVQIQPEHTGSEIIPLNDETQIALPSDENEGTVAVPVISPSFHLNRGTFHGANFGPQTNKKVIEANRYENATITHHHHYYEGEQKSSSEGSSSATAGATREQRPTPDQVPEGYVQISDDIFLYNKEPLREGTRIYKGYQKHVSGNQRPLAIKAIFGCEDKHVREVQHLLALAYHPNVVQIIQSKEHHGTVRTLYIAMELCSLQNLQDYLENQENIPFDFGKIMSFSKQLIDGMKHIHHNNIIHRDLKPGNILLSLDGRIKLSDFGISKKLNQNQIDSETNAHGTDGYRAPETYNSGAISRCLDIFSLGVTMYGLWSNGKHPFGNDIHLLNYNIKNNRGRDLSGLVISGPKRDELLDLIDQMLQPDPSLRPTIEQISEHPFFDGAPSVGDPVHAELQCSESQLLSEDVLPDQRDDDTAPLERTFSSAEQTNPKEAILEGRNDTHKPASPEEISPPAIAASQALNNHSDRRNLTESNQGSPIRDDTENNHPDSQTDFRPRTSADRNRRSAENSPLFLIQDSEVQEVRIERSTIGRGQVSEQSRPDQREHDSDDMQRDDRNEDSNRRNRQRRRRTGERERGSPLLDIQRSDVGEIVIDRTAIGGGQVAGPIGNVWGIAIQNVQGGIHLYVSVVVVVIAVIFFSMATNGHR